MDGVVVRGSVLGYMGIGLRWGCRDGDGVNMKMEWGFWGIWRWGGGHVGALGNRVANGVGVYDDGVGMMVVHMEMG